MINVGRQHHVTDAFKSHSVEEATHPHKHTHIYIFIQHPNILVFNTNRKDRTCVKRNKRDNYKNKEKSNCLFRQGYWV